MDQQARALRLQILAIENQTLLAQRSQLWGDASSRATMFLGVLSGAVVAIALTAQATEFDDRFFVFVLLLLPVVLFVGLTTVGRISEVGNEDFVIVQRLNRVRHGLLELDAEVARYLALSPHDDWPAISRSFGLEGEVFGRKAVLHGLRTLPALFSVVNCVVAAVLAGVIGIQLRLDGWLVAVLAMLVFIVLFALQLRAGLRSVEAVRKRLVSYYPSPEPETISDQPI